MPALIYIMTLKKGFNKIRKTRYMKSRVYGLVVKTIVFRIVRRWFGSWEKYFSI